MASISSFFSIKYKKGTINKYVISETNLMKNWDLKCLYSSKLTVLSINFQKYFKKIAIL